MKALKNVLLFLLSLCLLLSGTFVFLIAVAAEEQVINSASNSGTNITAQTVIIPTPCFTVSVPTGISLGSIERTETDNEAIASKSFTVGVSGMSNLDGKQVKVTLSTPYGGFYMFDGDNRLPYEVWSPAQPTAPVSQNGTFYTFTDEGEVTGSVKVDRYDIPAPGEYGGILTFTFHIEDQPSQP